MIKKTIQSFAFFALIQVFIFSCCDNTFNVFYDTIAFIAQDELDFDSTTIASEDLVLNLNPIYEHVMVSNFNDFKQFSKSAYATSCYEEYILKETITAINISANEDLFGIPAGNSLNEKISYINPETLEDEVLENIIEFLNQRNGLANDILNLVLNETIASGTTVAFTIQLRIEENDRTLEASTELITIE